MKRDVASQQSHHEPLEHPAEVTTFCLLPLLTHMREYYPYLQAEDVELSVGFYSPYMHFLSSSEVFPRTVLNKLDNWQKILEE